MTDFPKTIDSAVDLVLSRMSDDVVQRLAEIDESVEVLDDGGEIDGEMRVRVFVAKYLLGMNVRAMLGLWGENPELIAKLSSWHPDQMSTDILVECWRRIRNNMNA